MRTQIALLAAATVLAAGSALAQAPAPATPTAPPPAVQPMPAAKDAKLMPWSKNLTSRDLIGKKVYDPGGAPVADIKDVVTRSPNGLPEVVVDTPQAGQKKTVVIPLSELYMEQNRLMTNVFGGVAPRNFPEYSAKSYQKYDPNRKFGG